MKKGFLMALLAGLVAFSACESEEKKTNDPLGFNGAWTCLYAYEGLNEYNHRVFNGTVITGEWYRGNTPSTVDVEADYTFEIVDYEKIGDTEYNVTTRITSEITTLRTQQEVDSYNQYGAYGITDWKINEPRDTSSKNWSGGDRGDTYTIMKIDENGLMCYGLIDRLHPATSPDTRPVEYHPTWVWQRD